MHVDGGQNDTTGGPQACSSLSSPAPWHEAWPKRTPFRRASSESTTRREMQAGHGEFVSFSAAEGAKLAAIEQDYWQQAFAKDDFEMNNCIQEMSSGTIHATRGNFAAANVAGWLPYAVTFVATGRGDAVNTRIRDKDGRVGGRHDLSFGEFELVEGFASCGRARFAHAAPATGDTGVDAHIMVNAGLVMLSSSKRQ